MTAPTLAPGVYRLTVDLPALFRDKRIKRDWRYAPIPAGTLFAVREVPDPRSDDAPPLLVVSQLHGRAHQRVSATSIQAEPLVAHIERNVDVLPSERLAYLGLTRAAPAILDRLASKGLLTIRGVHKLLVEIDEKETT